MENILDSKYRASLISNRDLYLTNVSGFFCLFFLFFSFYVFDNRSTHLLVKKSISSNRCQILLTAAERRICRSKFTICRSKFTNIGSDNGFSPGGRQAEPIRTNAGILLIGPLVSNFSELLIKIYIFSFKKTHFKMLSAKCRPFCLGLNVSKVG